MALSGDVLGGQSESLYRKPNILMILVDDLGFGDLACQGATDLKTPHMDALMRAGMRMDPFYANCPVCSPTRAALLTGRYPDLAGVPGVIRTHQKDSWGYLSQHTVALPKVLKNQGYHTAMVGKWHLGMESPNTPMEQGFDFSQAFLGDMMDDYWTHRRHGFNYMVSNGQTIDPKGHATDLFSQWSVEYIKSRGQQQPFFLYLAYNAPHTPIQPPQDWLDRVKAREPGITDKRARLVALIEHLDHGIGQVIRALKDSGQSENTLVVFTSDNGGQVNVGANNGALHGGKQDMWEGGIRVPCCAVWPGKIKPGSHHTGQVAVTMDLYPTLCAAAEADISHPIDGVNLLPLWLGRPQGSEDRFVFWVRREGGPRYGGRAYYAARKGQWKLLQNTPFEPMQLFDLNADPGEQHPLPTTHKMYKELYQALQNHINRASGVPWGKYPVDVDRVYTGQ
ncbi:MAG: sulfatase-like hydrolase/transferase [Phycisphaerae bacterium]|nr:sulfatase-like hydrolase/transferase [Phycisphaerae bacterium]